MPFPVVDASDWTLAGHENLGLTEHQWLRPEGAGHEHMYLWKPAADRRLERREHLAEKIASEIAALLGVPCARVDLAARHGVAGCLSRNVQEHGWERRTGADLLLDLDVTFSPSLRPAHPAYTVANVASVLRDVGSPLDRGPAVPEGLDAVDVFAGYLLFDALIMNKDRHAANWSVFTPRAGGSSRLSALYDNASSLGLSMSEQKAERRLDGAGVEAYVRRESHARPFAGDLMLIDVAAQALRLCGPVASDHWHGQLSRLAVDDAEAVIDSIEELSPVMRRLATTVVASTRRWLLDELWS